jgi:hypothetical protein
VLKGVCIFLLCVARCLGGAPQWAFLFTCGSSHGFMLMFRLCVGVDVLFSCSFLSVACPCVESVMTVRMAKSSVLCFAEVHLLWAQHQVHHSSEEYNLPVGLRQSILQSWCGFVSSHFLVTITKKSWKEHCAPNWSMHFTNAFFENLRLSLT